MPLVAQLMAQLALTSTTKIVTTLVQKSALPRSAGTDSLASSLNHKVLDLANKVLQSSPLCVKVTPKPVNLFTTLRQPASKTTEQQPTITCTTPRSILTPTQQDKPNKEGSACRESTRTRVQAAWVVSAASTATTKGSRRASETHTIFKCATTSSETSNNRCSS